MTIGTIVKVGSLKTATVKVERSFAHPKYSKRIIKSKKFLVHDEIGVQVGDKVNIETCSPISKRKKHIIKEKL